MSRRLCSVPCMTLTMGSLFTELDAGFPQFRRGIGGVLLASRLVIDRRDVSRNLTHLVVLDVGRLETTGDPWEPYRLLDADGSVVEPVRAFLAELQARDCAASTLRSYGNKLLLWWRWLAAVEVMWNRATAAEGRDFARWMQIADKPVRTHCAPGRPLRSAAARPIGCS
jgi:hypothetical protein